MSKPETCNLGSGQHLRSPKCKRVDVPWLICSQCRSGVEVRTWKNAMTKSSLNDFWSLYHMADHGSAAIEMTTARSRQAGRNRARSNNFASLPGKAAKRNAASLKFHSKVYWAQQVQECAWYSILPLVCGAQRFPRGIQTMCCAVRVKDSASFCKFFCEALRVQGISVCRS